MTPEELIKQLHEKSNKCAFLLGNYSGALFQIASNVPDKLEFDEIKAQLNQLLEKMSKDIGDLFYGEE